MKRIASILIVILALVARAQAVNGIGGGINSIAPPVFVSYQATGTADQAGLQPILDAITGPTTIQLKGAVKLSSGIVIHSANTTLDATQATVEIGSTFTSVTSCGVKFGVSDVIALTATLASGSGSALTFSVSSYSAYNGEPVWIADNASGANMPGGVSSTTPYFIINLTSTGVNTGTFQLATSIGGTPITGTSTGTGGSFFAAYYATCTYNTSTNVITVLGTPAPTFASGANVIFGPTLGTLPTGISVDAPNYFLKPLTSNTYGVYLDPKFTILASTSGGSGTFAVYPLLYGMKMVGGSLTIDQGSSLVNCIATDFTPYGIILDSIRIQNQTTSSTTIGLRNAAFGARIGRITHFGNGFEIGLSLAGGQIVADQCTVIGAKTGIAVNNTKNGQSSLTNSTVLDCNQTGISVTTSAQNTLISNCRTVGNNTSGSGAFAEFANAGTGTILVGNQFLPISGQKSFIDTGSGTNNQQNTPQILASTNQTGLSAANGSILTYTPVSNGTFTIAPYLTINTHTTDTLKCTVTYTDENSNPQSIDLIPQGATTATLLTNSAFLYPATSIYEIGGSPITITTSLVASGGSINYDIGATISQTTGP